MTDHSGSCICGNIKYKVGNNPQRVTFCHCKFCQRATGGAYLVEPLFNSTDFSFTSGTAKTYTHVSLGSGQNVYIHFCDNCGTKVAMTFDRFDGITGVFGGTFDDPNWFDRSAENAKHIYLGVAQKGTIIPAGYTTYIEHAQDGAGNPCKATVFDLPLTIK
ncbi:MAG: GFA family protein [Rhodobacteraceae bacterium]|nr:GFA family protein [Paracoccaceae bacterium]